MLVEKTYIPKLDAENAIPVQFAQGPGPAETILEQRKEVLILRGRIYEDIKTAPSTGEGHKSKNASLPGGVPYPSRYPGVYEAYC